MTIIEHECKKCDDCVEMPEDIMIYYYDSKKHREKEWKLYDGLTDMYLNRVKYCPYCGDELAI